MKQKIFHLAGIEIKLTKQDNAIRLQTSSDNLLLAGQTFEETERVVNGNFSIVQEFYQKRANETIKTEDLNSVCLKIVFRFFYMHNLWRSQGKQIKNENLEFLEEDLEHPYSFDEIIALLKHKYPRQYSEKCALLLNLTVEKFKQYEKNRDDFFSQR